MGLDQAIDITTEQSKIVLELLERHLPNTTAWVYGSRAKWTSRPQSDLDLVVFATPEQSGRVSDLREAFEESNLPFRVDLFVWDAVPGQFRKHIKRDHVVLVQREGPDAAGGWCATTIGEVLTLQRGFDLPTTERKPGNYLVIASTGPTGTHNEAAVRGPGVVIGRSGSLGGGQFIKPDFWPLNTTLWVKDFKGNNPRFCYFLLKSIDLAQFNVGSGVPTLNRNHVHPLRVSLPPLPEQLAIAHILGTLDDKIELNRRMNETLEAMARALFKSWFVDFDPVRAKMAGRDTGLPKDIANLFPDRFEESELGEIPEGWEVGCLADIAVAPRRGVNPINLSGETPYIGLEHMPRRSIALTEWGNVGTVASNKSVFEKGEVLFGKLRPYFHKVGIAPVNGVCSTDIVAIASKTTEWAAFVLACVSSVEFVSYTNQASTGTKMPRTNWTTMGDYRMCLPTAPVARSFQNVAHPVLELIIANIHESHSLTALRDTLLPKLVSGELRVMHF